MRLLFGFLIMMTMMFGMASQAKADCTLGVTDCKDGYLWVCESCGSETCMIYKGTAC